MASRAGKKNMTPEQEALFLQLIAAGHLQEEAAEYVGVSPQCISNRKRRNLAFRETIGRMKAKAKVGFQSLVFKGATLDPHLAFKVCERRWPADWARPEIRAQLSVSNVSAAEIVEGIHKGLKLLAAKHAPFDEPDVDADTQPPGAKPKGQDEAPPAADVTRS